VTILEAVLLEDDEIKREVGRRVSPQRINSIILISDGLGDSWFLLEQSEQVPLAATVEEDPADVVLENGSCGQVNALNFL
jgi:hypothetical protein